MLSKNKIKKIIDQEFLVEALSDLEIKEFCQIANDYYRSGKPIISDEDYDFIYILELKKRLPNDPFLQS